MLLKTIIRGLVVWLIGALFGQVEYHEGTALGAVICRMRERRQHTAGAATRPTLLRASAVSSRPGPPDEAHP